MENIDRLSRLASIEWENLKSIIRKGIEKDQGQKMNDTEIRIMIQFADDTELKEQIDKILDEIHQIAHFRNCEITDLSLQEKSTGRYWDEYDGG